MFGPVGEFGDELDELTRLAIQARRGEPAVMASFIRATQREVYSLCAYLVDEATAEDLAQETYLRIFRALPRFRRESSARTWLLSIARRVCMDELRRRVRQRHRETLVPEFDTDRAEPWEDDGDGGDKRSVEARSGGPAQRFRAHPDTWVDLCRRRAHLWLRTGNNRIPNSPGAR